MGKFFGGGRYKFFLFIFHSMALCVRMSACMYVFVYFVQKYGKLCV